MNFPLASVKKRYGMATEIPNRFGFFLDKNDIFGVEPDDNAGGNSVSVLGG